MADGTIKVIVRSGYRNDGKRRTLWALAKDDAEAERVALELAAKLGMDANLGKGLTLSRWWDAYKVTRGKRITNAALERYTTEMKNTWIPELGDRDITLITHADIQAVLLKAKTRSMAKERKKALSAVLSHAVREGRLSANPCASAKFELPGDVGNKDFTGIDDEADPFAAIENIKDVWDVPTILLAMERLRCLPIETCWLAMVGAGLRREEALALRWRDVRRIAVPGGREVTQIAVHAANTAKDGRLTTKNKKLRIVAVSEPFGSRLWELRRDPDEPVCDVSPKNASRRWANMWKPVNKESRHMPRNPATHVSRGVMLEEPAIPFIHLKQMRHTHTTMMQAVGVTDSLNAAMHGHSERVAYSNYLMPDNMEAAERMGKLFVVEGGRQKGEGMQKAAKA
jgi:integrase